VDVPGFVLMAVGRMKANPVQSHVEISQSKHGRTNLEEIMKRLVKVGQS
jgi:hypothetical protein